MLPCEQLPLTCEWVKAVELITHCAMVFSFCLLFALCPAGKAAFSGSSVPDGGVVASHSNAPSLGEVADMRPSFTFVVAEIVTPTGDAASNIACTPLFPNAAASDIAFASLFPSDAVNPETSLYSVSISSDDLSSLRRQQWHLSGLLPLYAHCTPPLGCVH